MKLSIVAATLAATLLATAVQAQDQIVAPYNPTFSIETAALTNTCAAGGNERVYLKFGETVVAAPRAVLISFTPLRIGVVKEDDKPTGLALPGDAGCAGAPIAVAHAEFKLAGHEGPLMLATSTANGQMSGAAKSAVYLRDQGRCPKEANFIVCRGTQEVNGAKVETYAFIALKEIGESPSGEPYFALCEGSRNQAACEVSDELPGGISFRFKLPKGPPGAEAIKAVHVHVRALLETMKG